MRFRVLQYVAFLSLSLFTLHAPGQETLRPAATAKFHKGPNFPGCGSVAGVDGDSASGQSVVFIKLEAGCVLPWRWHTPNERVMMITGSAKAEMKGMPPLSAGPGDFLLMASKHTHQFTAITAAEFFVVNDGVFDLHYVDAAGQEISAAAALKAVGETAGVVPLN